MHGDLSSVWVHFANSALIWNTVLPCLVRAADRGRVLEPDEKGGTPVTFIVVEGAPHASNVTHPDEVNQAVLGFLGGLDGG